MGCGCSKNEQAHQVLGLTDTASAPPQKTPEPATKKGTTTDPPQKTPEPAAKKGTTTDSFVQDAVDHHNKLRASHGAPPMKAADDLIQYSQNWVNDIAKRDTMEHSKCTLPSGGRVGENIYMYWSSDNSAMANSKNATQSWYDEIKDYNFDKPGFAMNTGHFTQVVWKGSTELGIAWAKASSGSIYVVANYRPAGNMMGDFPDNVLPQS